MKLIVRDAFGQIRGMATVEWLPAYYEDDMTIQKECEEVFEESVTVPVPTRHPAMPWRFDVYPRL